LRPVFRDRDELPSTADLSAAVNDALARSEKLIVVCSPDAARSRWVNEEIRAYRRLGRADHILCLIVAGMPGSDDDDDCFPPALTEVLDGSEAGNEYAAADARPEGDGRRNALLKIIAGMLGVGFDDLRQRDHRRRQRRLAAVTLASLAIAVVTIVLAVTASIARQEAEFRRTQAEDLVDFMLGDLRERLNEIGRLDIYDSVGDEALKYFEAQTSVGVSDRTLAQRAKNLRQIGEIRMDQADLDAALRAFEQSLRITTELADRNPDDPQIQIDLANSHFYVGHVHFLKADLERAREQFARVLPIVNGLAGREPGNTRWLMEVGYAYTNLGRVLELEGSLSEAQGAYEKVMSADERLIELEPDNPEWDLEVGFAHNNLGKLAVAMGRLDEAEMHYRVDLESKERVLAANPEHNFRRNYLGVSQYYLGELLLDRGELAQGAELLSKSLANFERLLRVDPARANWGARRANVERELARWRYETGDTEEARRLLRSSTESFSRLLESDADNAAWRRDLVRGLLTSADFEARVGGQARAGDDLNAALNHLSTLAAQETANRDSRQLAIYADICRGQLENGDRRASAEAWRAAIDKLDQYFADSSDPHILDLRAAALAGLGDSDGAARLRARLRSMGFRGGRS
jgi:tetratricopeptide (TPR) repeat protein